MQLLQRPQIETYVRGSSKNYGLNALTSTTPQGDQFWYSYKTLVAFKRNGQSVVCRQNDWGTTTGKHLNAIEPNKKLRVDEATFNRLFNLAAF